MAIRESFSPDIADMEVVATKYHGVIARVAEHYKVSRETIYQYFNRNPEGKKIIEKVRHHNTETFLDLAEHVMRYNMINHKENPKLAQQAACKVVELKGHSRGWGDHGQANDQSKVANHLDKIRQELDIDDDETPVQETD